MTCIEPYNKCVAEHREQIDEMVRENPTLSARKLAEQLGTSEYTVRLHRKKMEIEISTTSTVKSSEPEPATCEIIQFGEHHVPDHIQDIFDRLSKITKKAERSLIAIWLDHHWNVFPVPEERAPDELQSSSAVDGRK